VSEIPVIPGPEGTADQFLAVIASLINEINQLNTVIADQTEQNQQHQTMVNDLQATIADLNMRLATNSANSSKPPSTDGYKPAPKSLRRKTGRKPGGQPGHQGVTLELSETPDQIITHHLDVCPDCGTNLSGQAVTHVERRQIRDIPPIQPVTIEHQLAHVTCPGCGHDVTCDIPDLRRQIQYGPNANTLMAYLVNAQYLSISRTAQAMNEIMGIPCSTATVAHAAHKAAGRLAEFITWVKPHLADAPVLHVDETGFKVAGHTMWAHSASTPDATFIDVHPRRGRQADDTIGIIPAFGGVLVHDAWKVYDTYPNVAAHQLCCAHVERETQSVIDYYHSNYPGVWCWAQPIMKALGHVIADPSWVGQARVIIRDALDPSSMHHPPGKLGNKHRALARRLTDRIDDYLRFTTTPGVPPTNNPAEQEIRLVKIKTKITGGMRTLTGAREFAWFRSYIATARKNNTPPLKAITSLFTNQNIWLPTTP
jgi:transposase